jgi:uncharacterized protein (TIGR00661 family)
MTRILVAPLDWGMGHTARCVCVINALQKAGAQVVVACNAEQQAFLEKEIQQVRYVYLAGYNITYAKQEAFSAIKIALQAPKIACKVAAEKRWLHAWLANEKIDGIISDNRYGIYHAQIPSVLITHQLNIQTAIGSWLVNKLNTFYINRFHACWVPDSADMQMNLSGILSHATTKAKHVQFIEPISRLEIEQVAVYKNQLLIILSGPEPQKSMLLEKILMQYNQINIPILVAGITTVNATYANVHYLGNVSTLEMQKLICESKYILTRSGYTSIMDLAKLGKRALLVPTPGQTEQVYLAQYMSQNKWHSTQIQSKLNVTSFLQKTNAHYDNYPTLNFNQHEIIIDNWVKNLGNK